MKLYNYLTLFIALANSTLVYPQKLGKLENLRVVDFVNENTESPIILSQETLITFPYRQDNNTAGAINEYFDLRIESVIRIVVSTNNTEKKILCQPKILEKTLKITSFKYYYLDGNSFKNRKIKESDLQLTADESGLHIDYSKIVMDDAAIIDISYRFDTKSKQFIKFNMESNKNYNEFNVQIYAPEIYLYNIDIDENCIKMETKKDIIGPMIGYRETPGPSDGLVSQHFVDFSKTFYSTKFEPAYCKINLFIFNKNILCTDRNKLDKEVINVRLGAIREIIK